MAHHPASVALIDTTGQVPATELQQYAEAFNSDIETNFGPVWGARAVVTVTTEETKPPRAWPIKIQTQLSDPNALGYHTDELNQPVSYVELTDGLSVTISHELKEMLADQFGNRMRLTPEPPPSGVDPAQFGLAAGDLVTYLVEVCDPPEDFSYDVMGVPCSDFIMPSWYDGSDGHCSFAGNCTVRQVSNGGYVSFARADNEWFQVFNQNGSLSVSDLGKFDKTQAVSLREWVDLKAREYRKANT